jgi:hypothetical protein
MRRMLLVFLAGMPLAACNTVQNEVEGGSFAALSNATEQAAPRKEARATAGKKGVQKDAGRHFVEFRSRYALSYGHTFLVHGRLNEKGEVGELTDRNVAGFHPAGAGPELWTAGHLVPVPAETGPSDGDLEEEYVSARYRVYLTPEQYQKVAAHIKAKQAAGGLWHAALRNCNMWVGEVAQFMGLEAPDHFLRPANYINEMARLNLGRQVAFRHDSASLE